MPKLFDSQAVDLSFSALLHPYISWSFDILRICHFFNVSFVRQCATVKLTLVAGLLDRQVKLVISFIILAVTLKDDLQSLLRNLHLQCLQVSYEGM